MMGRTLAIPIYKALLCFVIMVIKYFASSYCGKLCNDDSTQVYKYSHVSLFPMRLMLPQLYTWVVAYLYSFNLLQAMVIQRFMRAKVEVLQTKCDQQKLWEYLPIMHNCLFSTY